MLEENKQTAKLFRAGAPAHFYFPLPYQIYELPKQCNPCFNIKPVFTYIFIRFSLVLNYFTDPFQHLQDNVETKRVSSQVASFLKKIIILTSPKSLMISLIYT